MFSCYKNIFVVNTFLDKINIINHHYDSLCRQTHKAMNFSFRASLSFTAAFAVPQWRRSAFLFTVSFLVRFLVVFSLSSGINGVKKDSDFKCLTNTPV